MTSNSSTDNDETTTEEYVQLDIEGRIFNVTREEIKLFDSDFLNKLVDPYSPFGLGSCCEPTSNCNDEEDKAKKYVINDRNPTYFEAFLHVLTKPLHQLPQTAGAAGGDGGCLQQHPIDYFKFLTRGGSKKSAGGSRSKKQCRRYICQLVDAVDGTSSAVQEEELWDDVFQEADFWGVKHRIGRFLQVDEFAVRIQRAYFRRKGLRATRAMSRNSPLPAELQPNYQPCVGCGVRWGACEFGVKNKAHSYCCEQCVTNKKVPDWLTMATLTQKLGGPNRLSIAMGDSWFTKVACGLCHERFRLIAELASRDFDDNDLRRAGLRKICK